MGESIINQRQAVDTKTKAGIINKKERRRGRGERGQRKGRGGEEEERWEKDGEKGEGGEWEGKEERRGEDQLAAKARSMRERSSGVYMVW